MHRAKSAAPWLALAILTWAMPAKAADDWSQTFVGVSDGMALSGKKVLVVAGSAGEDSAAAATALAQALRNESKVALVLDANTVGDQAGQADPEILKKTAKSPVDLRIIVRVFTGDPPVLVVSLYDAKAEQISAHSGKKGQALFAESQTGGLGLAGSGAEATVEKVSNLGDDRQAAIEQYAKQFLWLGTNVVVSQSSASSYDVVYQGKYKKALTRAELYKILNDPELDKKVTETVAENKQSNLIGLGAMLGGTVVLGALTAWGIWQYDAAEKVQDYASYDSQAYQDASFMSSVALLTAIFAGIGAGTTALGSIGLAMGYFSPDEAPNVLEPDALRERIERYNAQLRKDLGIEGIAGLPTGL